MSGLEAPPAAAAAAKKPRKQKAVSAVLDEDDEPAAAAAKKPRKKAKAEVEGEGEDEAKPVKAKKEVKPAAIVFRTPTPSPLFDDVGHKLKVVVWNMAGLRAQIKNAADAFHATVATLDADIICFQEHKLQSTHVPEFLSLLPGYESFWICSEKKKGYSGVACFVKSSSVAISKDLETTRPALGSTSLSSSNAASAAAPSAVATLRSVTYEISGDDNFTGEGRAITLEFDSFFLVNVYVPNAGQGLKNIDYRVDSWDPELRNYLAVLRATGKGVVCAGDLNVAHADADVYNAGAKHLVKQPGCTARERESFSLLLSEEAGFVDSFRHFFPTATGCYSFWSGMNVVARGENKGLRLDYFVVSKDLLLESRADGAAALVVDSQINDDVRVGSTDHCPISLTLLLE